MTRDAPVPGSCRVARGDITALAVEAIVNAAQPALLGGGGVDGAIHRAAGPGLLAECRGLPESRSGVRCPTGEARITGGHRLHARHVIHVVGPVWRGGDHGEAALLASCYRRALDLARRHAVASIAFPAISCGVYGYPPDHAVPVAVSTVLRWLEDTGTPMDVVFSCFDAAMAARYRTALATPD
ncbi:O-acetyl-ADP-ribose deacetylase [Marilutibacter spongiae]|uniref:O-acetyl-ADP-ribose deacetylase n=1 Tax=Marilutibacter spongiae TaxID=2025720 RepID=A0A7W3TKT6_9GAMM|nr:O-acetyl-ADP-ribose deacetylase [Lysobacter spongiae]MBB1060160.1 O-acetyl-ADP-ribose deacetylase [Lysobacter spongiae]